MLGPSVVLHSSVPCLTRRFALQQSAAEGDEGWDHMAMAPGHTLRDFLHDPPLTLPPTVLPTLPTPPPLRGAT